MTERKATADPGRPLTVAELVLLLADFRGDELVYAPGLGGVRSARKWTRLGVPRVELSNLPAPERPRGPTKTGRLSWLTKGLRELAAARVHRGPLGSSRR
jgi:hypothetical protein